MKKIFTFLTLILLLPLSVNAEVKEINNKVYVTGEHDIKYYYCEELINNKNVYYSIYHANGVVLFDETDIDNPKRYLLDMKNKKCKSITGEEFESLENNNDYKEYRLLKDNKIYEVSYTDEGIIEKYVKVKDGLNFNNDYYILEDNKYVKVENLNNDDIDKYYELAKFGKAQGEYYSYIDYYILKDNTMIIDDAKTEEKFNNGIYYEKKLKNSIYKEVATFNKDKLVLKKELSGLDIDLEFISTDFYGIYKIFDKLYVSHEVGIGAAPALALFDLEGNSLVIDGHCLFGRSAFTVSDNDLLTLMIAESDEKSYNYIVDKDFNVINKKEFKSSAISYIPTYINTNEHIEYFTVEGLIDRDYDNIIEVRKYYLIKGDKKYNNKDMYFTLSANLKDLKSIFINDKELNKDNYSVKDNVLTLNNKYLATLNKGNYKLKVLYNDGGYVNTDFIVDSIANPPTGDSIMKSIVFGIISLIGLIVTILFIKNKKQYN